ncbi:hypothetical protein ABEB36_008747 [Hypothenemus hampei]|uniref:BHLH domain-containing protein n=1 Tax=Hypothenemus hampei TaxID=57062 RepID=A0ABD1EMY6_HYPHA
MFYGIMTNGNCKLNFKDMAMATSNHEDSKTSFCSTDEYNDEPHSPTDSSEDSVEVKVSTISFNHKKRKLLFESRNEISSFSGPLKKRMCLKVKAEENEKTPFRPWSSSKNNFPVTNGTTNFAVPRPIKPEPTKPSAFSYFRPPSPIQQTEPVSLVIKREKDELKDVRVPMHPQIAKLTPAETERLILKTNEQFPGLKVPQPSPTFTQNVSASIRKSESKREQRNYKNMTRERRIEANARERTRVHTISAAFDTLRRAIPSYSHNQKLSKLSVLRIACSYIMTLSSLVGNDETMGEPCTSECIDLVSRTIQKEGKLRKKKDESD